MGAGKVVASLFALVLPAASLEMLDGFFLSRGHSMWYRIARPALLQTKGDPAPLVVCHGGPQVPSDYLFALEGMEDRPIIWYDQLGCGRSDRPTPNDETYSVEASARDLESLLSTLKQLIPTFANKRFHLYGQSWGGLLAFEHVSAQTTPQPLTLTLSNVPTSVDLVEAEASRLVGECGDSVEEFMSQHNCRVQPEPALLTEAYKHAGSTWRGTSAIAGLAVTPEQMSRVDCPTLCLRGEFDFVTEACVADFKGVPEIEFVTLSGCSHHALLESPDVYFDALQTFLRKHDLPAGV